MRRDIADRDIVCCSCPELQSKPVQPAQRKSRGGSEQPHQRQTSAIERTEIEPMVVTRRAIEVECGEYEYPPGSSTR